MYRAVTRKIEVTVTPRFVSERSSPADGYYFWSYTIDITNLGSETVQLKIQRLLKNEGIVRNRLKVEGTVKNAKAFLSVQKEFGAFDAYLWQFVGGNPIVNAWKSLRELPVRTTESDAMSKDLRKRGFTFVGSMICYALMQAVGMVNDHTIDCFRYPVCTAMR